MSGRYVIAPGVAWLDASEGGRADPVAWAATLPDGPAYELGGPAWLVWLALAAGAARPAELASRITVMGGPAGVAESDLQGFLDELLDRGLLEVR